MKFLVCLLTLVSNAAGLLDLSGKVFTFPQETNTARVKLIPASPLNYQAVTVCHRSFTDLKRDHSLFSLASPTNHNEFLVFMKWGVQEIQPHVHNLFSGYGGLDYAPNKWHSICTTWDSSSGLVQLWFNGQPLMKRYIAESPLTTKPIIVLGQEQDNHGGGFVAQQSFVGMMTDVHMWNYVISPCEIEKFMKEENFTPGNALNWAALGFQITGRVLIENKQMSCDVDKLCS